MPQPDRKVRHDRKRERAQPWRAWYRSKRWREETAAFLAMPRNRRCSCGCGRRSTIVDHIKRCRGDPRLFWDRSNWQGMSSTCHNSAKQQEETLGYSTALDSNGIPIDLKHPFHRGC